MLLLVILAIIAIGLGAAAVWDRRHRGTRIDRPAGDDRNANEAAHRMASQRTFQNYNGTFGG